MILNLRGTSGSGKSTIVRSLMELYTGGRTAHTIPGRKQPVAYSCFRPHAGRGLWVVGHYETPCGGADTISQGLDAVYRLVTNGAENDYDVVYEGLIVQSDIRRQVEIAQRFPTIVIGLSTPLEVCLEGINARRRARGIEEPVNPKNTETKMKSLPNQQRRLLAAGVDFRLLSRDEALETCRKALGWS